MKPLWLLDAYLLERSSPANGVDFPRALLDAGCEVSVHAFDARARVAAPVLPTTAERPVLAYGSFAFVRHVLSRAGADAPRPGSFAKIDNLSFSRFSAHIGDLLLSDDFVVLPFGELLRRPAPGRTVFVKPDRVTKSFTGFQVVPERFAFEISCLERVSRVSKEELVVVASAREIELECRFVVADGRVVAGSTYGWADGFVPSAGTDPRCEAVAREVAGREWQADTVYTCDVALSGGEAKVVELNSFSCAGLYACDTRAVAEAVTACMLDEYGLY